MQKDKLTSNDSDLQSLLDEIGHISTNITSAQARELAMYKTVVYVGELLQGLALPLPDALDFFKEAYNDNFEADQQRSESKVS